MTLLVLLGEVGALVEAVRLDGLLGRAPQGLPAARGQGVVEYGIILGLSALLALVILVVFGDQVADIVQWIGRTVDAATGGR